MASRVGSGYRVTVKNGKTVLEKDHAGAEAKLDLCARLRRKHSKKIRPVKPAK